MDNEKINLPPFYVGQKVVALETVYELFKDNIYTVRSTKSHSCGCWAVDVGVTRSPLTKTCSCIAHDNKIEGSDWFTARYFAPIESKFQSITCERVVEIESPLIGAN